MNSLFHDLRFAVRSLRRRTGLTLVIVLTGGLAIGAATALIDLANLVAWMPIPGTDPKGLVRIHNEYPQPAIGLYGGIPSGDVPVFTREASSFQGLASERWGSLELVAAKGAVAAPTFPSTSVSVRFVSGNYFELLGAQVAWGRPLQPSDDRSEAPAAAVLSQRFFRSHLAGDDSILGQTVLLNDQAATIVGVAAEDFETLVVGNENDLWLTDRQGPRFYPGYDDTPLVADADLLGRLVPGVTVQQAQAELQNLAESLDKTNPLPTLERNITVIPARASHGIDRRNFEPILRMLAAAVAVLMVLACANIANMLLGRSLERAREISVRLALGAGRRRLIRQLLTESLVLAFAAGAVGLLFALGARRLFGLWSLEGFAEHMRFDHRVLGASVLTCVLASLLFGLLPAFATTRTNLVSSLKDGAGAVRRSTLRAFQWLAGVQVALAMTLLVCTGAIAANLWTLGKVDLGFDDRGLVRNSLFFSNHGYSKEEAQAFMVELEQRAAGLPMVQATSRSLFVPPVFLEVERTFKRPDDPENQLRSRLNIIDDGYFDTLGIDLIHGRSFDQREREGQPTVILNEMLARQIWPGEDPGSTLGRTLLFEQRRPDDPPPEHTVIGIVQTIKQHDLTSDGEPILYLPIDQRPRPSLSMIARVDGDPELYMAALKGLISDLDPKVQPGIIQTLQDLRWDALVVQRLQSQSVAILAIIGGLLSLVGIFGVMQLMVARRRREVGIRMAVGANRIGIVQWVLGKTLMITLSALAAGLLASFAATTALRGWVENLGVTPWWVYVGSAVVLLVAGLAASLWPAGKAAQTQPASVLRAE